MGRGKGRGAERGFVGVEEVSEFRTGEGVVLVLLNDFTGGAGE